MIHRETEEWAVIRRSQGCIEYLSENNAWVKDITHAKLMYEEFAKSTARGLSAITNNPRLLEQQFEYSTLHK